MKSFSLSVLALLFVFFAQAQTLPTFQMGLKAGANFSKFDTENTFNSDNRTGFYGLGLVLQTYIFSQKSTYQAKRPV